MRQQARHTRIRVYDAALRVAKVIGTAAGKQQHELTRGKAQGRGRWNINRRHRRSARRVHGRCTGRAERRRKHLGYALDVILVHLGHRGLVGGTDESGAVDVRNDALDATVELLRVEIDGLGASLAAEREHLWRKSSERITYARDRL